MQNVCVFAGFEEWKVTQNENKFERGYTKGFAKDLTLHFNLEEFSESDGNDIQLKLKLQNSNIGRNINN